MLLGKYGVGRIKVRGFAGTNFCQESTGRSQSVYITLYLFYDASFFNLTKILALFPIAFPPSLVRILFWDIFFGNTLKITIISSYILSI